MKKIKENLIELIAFIVIILIFVGLPMAIWWYEDTYLPSRYPEGTKIIKLSAKVSQDKCLWTLEDINGFNYWWKKFKFADEIFVNEGDSVVFRVKSADVMHSFAIPRFRIGPYEIEAGKPKETTFEAERVGKFKYLCWLWCSDCHSDLNGRVVVME